MNYYQHSSRVVRVAQKLVKEKGVIVPHSVFNDVVSKVTSVENINLISKRPNRGCFEVNGLMSDIRKFVTPLIRKYQGKYNIILDNKSASENRRCLICIRPILPKIPERAKAKFEDGVPRFVDGPFRGEEVVWSSRVNFNEVPVENDIGEDVFVVEPDKYRSTFYGWKKKY